MGVRIAMTLIDIAQFENPGGQICAGPFHSAGEALRRKVLEIGLALDGAGGELIQEVLEAAANAEQQIAEQRARIRYLEDLSISDELTDILNRRGFRLELDRALARAARHGESGVLLLCDLNGFKAVNDSLGHQAGDAVLRAVARELARHTRRSDCVGRLGGDEFAVLMTGSRPDQTLIRAGMLADQINALQVRWRGQTIAVSAAFGLEVYDGSSNLEALLGTADRALYRDKPPRLLEAV